MFKCMTYGGAAPSGAAAVGTSALDLGFLACYLAPARHGAAQRLPHDQPADTGPCLSYLSVQPVQGDQLAFALGSAKIYKT